MSSSASLARWFYQPEITWGSDCTTKSAPHEASSLLKWGSYFNSSSLDHTMATSSGLILQICLIMVLLCAASTVGSARSTAKFHLHGALHSAHKSCTHMTAGCNCKRSGEMQQIAPWTSSTPFSYEWWPPVHSLRRQKVCYRGSRKQDDYLQLSIRSHLNFTLWYAVNIKSGLCEFPCTPTIRILGVSHWSPLHFCSVCSLLLYVRQHIGTTHPSSTGGQLMYHRSWSLLYLHLPSTLLLR